MSLPPSPALGTLRLTLQGSQMTTSLVTPTVVINGYRVPARYGLQDIPVHAGPTRVEIFTEWTRTYGRADVEMVVAPGQVVPLFYATPWHVFSKGALGPAKQRKPGIGCLLGVGLASLALLVAVLSLAWFAGP